MRLLKLSKNTYILLAVNLAASVVYFLFVLQISRQ